MKKYFFLSLAFLFIGLFAHAQGVPPGINYQAVARDGKGVPLAGREINLKISLLAGDAYGKSVYEETHRLITNELGVFSLVVGQGSVEKGNFTNVPWSEYQIWMEIALDEDGNGNYLPLSASRLMAVPYAFHAGTADQVKGDDGTEKTAAFWKVNGNDFTFPGPHFIGTIDSKDFVIKTTNQERIRVTAAGDIYFSGSLFIALDINVGRDANVGRDGNFGRNLDVDNNARIGNDLDVDRDVNVDRNLTTGGIARFNNTTQSTTKDNGAVVIEGGLGVEKNLNVGGAVNFGGNLDLSGILHLTNTTQSTTKDNGALIVEGGVGIEKNINIGGNSTVTGNSTVGGNTTVNGDLNVLGKGTLSNLTVSGMGMLGPNGEHVALFENTAGGQQDGIAIKINKDETTSANNFITFYRGNTVAGRIEGFDLSGGDSFNDFPSVDFSDFFNIFDFNSIFSGGSLPSVSFSGGSLPGISIDFTGFDVDFDPGSLPTLNFNPGSLPNFDFSGFFNPSPVISANGPLAQILCWSMDKGLDGFVTTNPFDLALTAGKIAAAEFCKDGGVTYGSTGADYAEWLPKLDPEERFITGQIVGVHGGRISKKTEGADQVMSITMAPIILGNVPKEGQEHLYEKVGFMGQVPVLVRGAVNLGDFILSSGNNDGYGIAVSPKDIRIEHLSRIVGRAWSESDKRLPIDMINVSVGLKTNEWIQIFQQQQQAIHEAQQQYQTLESRLNSLEARMQSSLGNGPQNNPISTSVVRNRKTK
ncbi:MAG: hypothetical protein KF852_09505 [Saprospiraceae bacterium]|nr:hypothetical protein [Saprospiraceae bacterium]